MRLTSSAKVNIIRVFMAVFLMIVLVGCGEITTSNSTTNTPVTAPSVIGNTTPLPSTNNITPVTDAPTVAVTPTSSTGNSVTDPGNIPPLSQASISTNVDGMSIGAVYDCSHYSTLDNLVLVNAANTTYDVGTVNDIKSYLANYLNNDASSDPLPPSLQRILGASTNGVCDLTINITNISNSTIQLSGAGVQISSAPQQNNFQYNLIDGCAVFPHENLCGRGGHSSNPFTQVNLNSTDSGTTVTNTFSIVDSQGNTQNNIVATLSPNDIVTIDLLVQSSNTPANLIYTVTPQLIMNSSSGPQSIQLPSAVLVFADESRFSCYQLQPDGTIISEQMQDACY